MRWCNYFWNSMYARVTPRLTRGSASQTTRGDYHVSFFFHVFFVFQITHDLSDFVCSEINVTQKKNHAFKKNKNKHRSCNRKWRHSDNKKFPKLPKTNPRRALTWQELSPLKYKNFRMCVTKNEILAQIWLQWYAKNTLMDNGSPFVPSNQLVYDARVAIFLQN